MISNILITCHLICSYKPLIAVGKKVYDFNKPEIFINNVDVYQH